MPNQLYLNIKAVLYFSSMNGLRALFLEKANATLTLKNSCWAMLRRQVPVRR